MIESKIVTTSESYCSDDDGEIMRVALVFRLTFPFEMTPTKQGAMEAWLRAKSDEFIEAFS